MTTKISFEDAETGLAKEFFVLASTVIKGNTYLLVTEYEEGDSDALILKDVTPSDDADSAVYDTVTEGKELEDAIEAFGEMLEDVEFE
ncbi:MAG: DUF1292 domain-containing protein [Lachnospiraceae bacterium]|nr:DUF1292 domain-containing protein [Lachnospiraceae bacterium]